LPEDKFQIDKLISDIISGDRYALSRGLTLVESKLSKDRQNIIQLVEACWKTGRKSWRIGVTGSPGVGKSSFIEQLGLRVVNEGKKVAVLSIDPSSLISKGSILGDKTRMEKLSKHVDAFIRPSANRGELGGVQKRSFESIILCEAAGYDVILVETVGIGQAESDIRNIVDMISLLVLPGSGDELQGIKKGILELSDVIIMHKADGNRIAQADRSLKEYINSTHLSSLSKSPHLMKASSLTNEGIEEFWSYCKEFFSDHSVDNRLKQHVYLTRQYVFDMLEEYVHNRFNVKQTSNDKLMQKSPLKCAAEIFESFDLN